MTADRLGGPMAADRPADRPSDASSTDATASTDASSPTTPTGLPATPETWPLLEKPALPPAATESRWERWCESAPDAVVVAQAVGRSEAVRKNVREAVGMAIAWGMVVGVGGLTVLDDEDFWSDATLVVAIAATITVVVFVVKTWAERTRVEVHPHEIVTEAVSWWRRNPIRLAIGFDEITSVDLDDEDGPKLVKVQTTLGRTISGIPDGPGRAAALAIGQRLVAHGRAHTIQNHGARIHLGLGRSDWPTY
jgi:hypothetical protein